MAAFLFFYITIFGFDVTKSNIKNHIEGYICKQKCYVLYETLPCFLYSPFPFIGIFVMQA